MPSTSWSDVDDVVALLDHLGLETVSVVGSSYGGAIALELATVAPQRVSKLVLLCPGGDGEPTPDVEAFGEAENALLSAGDVEGAVDLNVRTWLGPEATDETRDQLAAWQRHTFDVQADAPDDIGPQHVDVDPATRRRPHHGGDRCPRPRSTSRRLARRLAERMPRARLVELDWAGHLPSLERPAEITDLLLAELSR